MSQKEARYHAVELRQCTIFAADVGENIAKAMIDAADYLDKFADMSEPVEHMLAAEALCNAAAMEPTIPNRVRDFLGKVQGVCMGIAMSGKDHPNPDGALLDLFNEAQDILFPSEQKEERILSALEGGAE